MTDDQKLDEAINRAFEEAKPSDKETISRLKNAMKGTRETACRQTPELSHNNIQMPITAYQEL